MTPKDETVTQHLGGSTSDKDKPCAPAPAVPNRSAKRDADHIWHVWMNSGGGFEPDEQWGSRMAPKSLYEFKHLLEFLDYGHQVIQQAFTGQLPKVHRQCSRTTPEPIANNCLKCSAFGTDVTDCKILLSIKTTFEAERQRELGKLGKVYEHIPDEEMYRRMAQTCAWHIYREATRDDRFVDTSEGYLLTVGDRMFWGRVYESMAAIDQDSVSSDVESPDFAGGNQK